jgi:hypothetical protein
MTDRETPSSADNLYEARVDVPLARPIMQGDVFREIVIPGVSDEPTLALIIQHPCSMRAGVRLRSRLTVVRVTQLTSRFQPGDWQGYINFMPLPELTGAGSEDYIADFRDVGSVGSGDLTRDKRIAVLSNYGINILHQRHIFYSTRFTVDVPTLADAFVAIATETELQYEWVEAACDAAPDKAELLKIIDEAEIAFDAFLSQNDRERRKKLQEASTRADVRREVRREIDSRY